jgi:hypothetical protein
MAAVKTADPKALVGKRGTLTVVPNPKAPENVMHVEVRIVEAYPSYGRVDVLVEPVKGSGAVRVMLKSVKLNK